VACAALAVALERPVTATEPATVASREGAVARQVATPAHSGSTP